ncbi:hypothetical protein ABFB10_07145 [Ponticoccus litoralis]|uniref:Uncharacterized protein n=1 Tax=Ponticoccus litoralis TaxID=422297 RepID=A0AAW9S7S3_9RHOB
MAAVINRPGSSPATSSCEIEVLVMAPTITSGMLGGTMGPTVAEAAVTAAAKPGS